MAQDDLTSLPRPTQAPRRLLSLDAFRGFDIAAMLLVNLTWDRAVFPRQFFHVGWNDPVQSATFADLVYPWFIWIAGAAIPLSMRSGRGQARPWWMKLLVALRRAVVIYLLGVLITVASFADKQALVWADLGRWNILQIIGAAYFVAVAVYLLPAWARVVFVGGVLLAKWAVMTGLSVGEAEPGTWQHWQDVRDYLSGTYGWFGMAQQFLPAGAIAVLGGMTTELLLKEPGGRRATLRVLGLGAALTAVAFVWHSLPGTTFHMPFSKWFFTPSYCLLAAGTGAMLLAGFHYVADVRQWSSLWVLRVYGLNAIALYVAAELTFKLFWSRWQIPTPTGEAGSIAGATMDWLKHGLGTAPGLWVHITLYLLLWWLFCWWLYRKKIFIKV